MLVQELIATAEQKKRSRKSETGYEDIVGGHGPGKDRKKTATAAKALYQWLKKPHSPLRDLLAVLSDGGTFFCSSTYVRSGSAAVQFRVRPDDAGRKGITEDEFVLASQVHHFCQ